MPNNNPNPYSLGNLPSIDPQTRRVFQDLVDRINYLTNEVETLRGRDIDVLPSMAARRENPIEGIITIPYRDHGGRDGSIRVNKDGVIQSYVNSIESMFPYVDISIIGNITTGLDTLHTLTIPPGTLGKDGDYFDVFYAGTFAANDNDKSVNALIGGSAYENTGVLDIDTLAWILVSRIIRLSATTVRTSHFMDWGALHVNTANAVNAFNIGSLVITRNSPTITVTNLDTTSVVMEVKGEGTATDDVVQNMSIISLYRPRTVKRA